MKNIEFNEDQIDILKEFMNIAIGEATSHIAELLGAFGTMHIYHLFPLETLESLKKS